MSHLFVIATKLYRPPSFILTDPSVTVVEGETAILPCLATGYPSPGISWSRQGNA